MATIVTFRLRPGKDDDIQKALDQVAAKEDRSDVIRAALRAYLLGEPGKPRQLQPDTVDDINLERTEKDDAQLDADLDTLLNF